MASAYRAPPDTHGDGIPDAVDILIGAKKAVLLATPYVETNRKLPHPGGDMPADEGVCTDVVVRALRNAGLDLQKAVYEDAGRAPKAYPAIVRRNPSIDHRRVRNLLPWFERHFRKVPIADLLPGDVVLLDTFPGRKGVEHIGVVSDRVGESGRPLIANAWTNGFRTSEMDLLGSVAAPAAYRVPAARTTAPSRAAIPPFQLSAATTQLVLAISDAWFAPSARLSLWERRGGGWRRRTVRCRRCPVARGWAGDAALGLPPRRPRSVVRKNAKAISARPPESVACREPPATRKRSRPRRGCCTRRRRPPFGASTIPDRPITTIWSTRRARADRRGRRTRRCCATMSRTR